MRVLFITWDGPQLAYLESLFLPIFAGLQSHDLTFDVLQFRWGPAAGAKRLHRLCHDQGVGYTAVNVWRRPVALGSFASAISGAVHVRRAVRKYRSDVIMPRSSMPALATLVAGGSRLRPIVFDADGLEADERVEYAGLSDRSAVYRVLRDVEAQIVRHSSSLLVRSTFARDVLLARAGPKADAERFHVVTNGRDPEIFQPASLAARDQVRAELGVRPEVPLIVYAGSTGGKYRLERLAEFMRRLQARNGQSRLLVLSGALDQARHILAEADPHLAAETIFKSVPPDAVPRYLGAADVGTVFIRPSFSMRAVAPVKTAEYLLCGLPVVGTAEVGDNADLVAAGVYFDEGRGLAAAAEWVERTAIPERARIGRAARRFGLNKFSLDASIAAYARALSTQRAPA